MSQNIHIVRSMHIEGGVSGDVDATVDGTVTGWLCFMHHDVLIGTHASVNADVQARTVRVRGQVVGRITAERLEIAAGGSVHGDILVRKLVLDEGSVFKGKVNTEPASDPCAGASSAA